MKYQDFSFYFKNHIFIACSEDTIFIFHTVKISFLFDNIFLLSLKLHLNLLMYDRNIFGSPLVVFGNLGQSSVIFAKCSEMLGKCSEASVWPLEQYWKIFGNLRKVVGNLRKIVKKRRHYWVCLYNNRILHARLWIRILSSHISFVRCAYSQDMELNSWS